MSANPYQDIDVVLLSMHDKAPLIAPAAQALGWRIHTDATFDTDSLGTFSRDIPRQDDQYQTALHKAKLACQRNGARYGLGSEGSVAPDPSTGLIQLGVELLVLYDAAVDKAVTGSARAPSPMQRLVCHDRHDLAAAALRLGAPLQHLVLFAGDLTALRNANPAPIAKGITDLAALQQLAAPFWAHGSITLETDYRAFACPGRQQIIAQAAMDLITRLQSQCPKCQQVDFSVRDRRTGLPCQACGFPTPLTKALVRRCTDCGYEQVEPVAVPYADPTRCPLCNP